MGRTFKHDKDGDYAKSGARGSLIVDRSFVSDTKSNRQEIRQERKRKKKDKEFRKGRKYKELHLGEKELLEFVHGEEQD